jgi:zinc protease
MKSNASGNTILMQLVVNVGHGEETADQYGLAHLVEHVGMRSTKNFPEGVVNYFVGKGLVNGKDMNASTNETTNYYLSIPSDDSTFLELGMLALRDWGGGLSFLSPQIDEERSAVGREISNAMIPNILAFKNTVYLQLNKNPLYVNNNLRDLQNVRTASEASLIRFYKDWYHPVNEAVIIVGNLNEDSIEIKIKKHLSDLDNIGARIKISNTEKLFDVPLSTKNQLIIEEGVNYPNIKVKIYKKKKSNNKLSPNDKCRQNLMDDLFGIMINHRLETIHQQESLPMEISLSISRNGIHPRANIDVLLVDFSIPILTDLKSSLHSAICEMERLECFGFSDTEFRRAKEIKLFHLKNRKTGLNSLASRLAEYYINKIPFLNDEDKLEIEMLKSITKEEINLMVESWLKARNNIDVVISNSEKGQINLPTEGQVFSWINESYLTKVQPYVEPTIKQFTPLNFNKNENQYKIIELPNLDVTKLVLPNGITILLKQAIPGLGESDITFNAIKPYRNPHLTNQKYKLALQNIRLYTSLGKLDPNDLLVWGKEQQIRGDLGVYPFIKNDEVSIVGNASNENIKSMFRLICAYFMESRIDKTNFEKFIRGLKTISPIKINFLLDPVEVVIGENYATTNVNKMDSNPSLNEIIDIYKEQFSNAATFTFIITGRFNKAEMVSLASQYLGSIKTNPGVRKCKFPSLKIEMKPFPTQREISFIGDSTSNVNVRLIFQGSAQSDTKNKLILEVLKNALTTILYNRLRQIEKGVYSVLLNSQFGKYPREFFLDIQFETAFSDINRLNLAIKDELGKLSKGIIQHTVFENSIAILRDGIIRENNSSRFWSFCLATLVRKGALSDSIPNRLDILNSITPTDVTNFIKNGIDTNNCIVIKVS